MSASIGIMSKVKLLLDFVSTDASSNDVALVEGGRNYPPGMSR